MSGNDIFGNLDDFLENYNDSCLETSRISEVENNADNSTMNESRFSSILNNKSSPTAKTCRMASNKVKGPPKQTISVSSVPEAQPTGTGSVAPPAVFSHPTTVDLTIGFSLQEEMYELTRMYNFVFYNRDPIVITQIKSHRLFNSTKRSFLALNNRIFCRLSKKSEVTKLKKKIETVQVKLAQLHSFAETILTQASVVPSAHTLNQSTPRTRRRRTKRSNNSASNSVTDASVIIILDDDPVTDLNPVTPMITLDSDDDSIPQYNAANNSFETENYEMRIKIKWGNDIETFNHRKHQKFGDLIAKLAANKAADTGCILLNLEDRVIYAEDTPDSIGYKTYQFISGRVLKEKAPTMLKTTSFNAGNNNIISLKLQLATCKIPLRLQIDKNQTMAVLLIKCAEELKCKPDEIKLYFDGDLVDKDTKPEHLELEGDEVLDIRFVS